MAYLLPMDEVFAMEQGNAREVLETAVHQVVVVASAADAGVGMEAGNDGVLIPLCVLCQAGHSGKQSEAHHELFKHNYFYCIW